MGCSKEGVAVESLSITLIARTLPITTANRKYQISVYSSKVDLNWQIVITTDPGSKVY